MEPLNLAALSMEFPKGVVYVLMRKYNFLEHALCIQQMVCVGPGCEFSSLHSMLHNCTVSPSSMAYYQLGGPIGYKLSPIRELGLYTKLNSPAPIFVLPLSRGFSVLCAFLMLTQWKIKAPWHLGAFYCCCSTVMSVIGSRWGQSSWALRVFFWSK